MSWFMRPLIMLIQIPSGATGIKAGADRTYWWMNRTPCPHTSAVHVGVTEMLCS